MERLHSARRPQSTLHSDAIPHARTSSHFYTCLPEEEGHSNGFDVGDSSCDRGLGWFGRLGSCDCDDANRCGQDEDNAQRCRQR